MHSEIVQNYIYSLETNNWGSNRAYEVLLNIAFLHYITNKFMLICNIFPVLFIVK